MSAGWFWPTGRARNGAAMKVSRWPPFSHRSRVHWLPPTHSRVHHPPPAQSRPRDRPRARPETGESRAGAGPKPGRSRAEAGWKPAQRRARDGWETGERRARDGRETGECHPRWPPSAGHSLFLLSRSWSLTYFCRLRESTLRADLRSRLGKLVSQSIWLESEIDRWKIEEGGRGKRRREEEREFIKEWTGFDWINQASIFEWLAILLVVGFSSGGIRLFNAGGRHWVHLR